MNQWDPLINTHEASVFIWRGALFSYNHLVDEFIKAGGWHQDEYNFGRKEVLAPRLTKFYADPGVSYTYSGAQQEVWPWSDMTAALKTLVEYMTSWKFNSLLVNYYRDGNDSVGWHSDDEPEVGPTLEDRRIASVSFGAARTFSLKRNRDNFELDTILYPGDLLVMQGNTQDNFRHRIPKQKNIKNPRINLTFRSLI